MLLRLLFALLALGLIAVLYFQMPESGNVVTGTDAVPLEPGYVALGAQLVETGQDGQPLYRLDASRIEQPTPMGTIYLTNPKLNYRPPQGNPWTLTAQQGQMPQDAHTADLHGDVHGVGQPTDSGQVMALDTQDLHVDMVTQIATTADEARVVWGQNRLRSLGMRANLMTGKLVLERNVSGVLAR